MKKTILSSKVRSITLREAVIWGTCAVCGAKHGESCVIDNPQKYEADCISYHPQRVEAAPYMVKVAVVSADEPTLFPIR